AVNDLVHWRDPKKSGVVFGVSLLLLLSLAAFSMISVVSYLLLALLCVTISFRIYKSVIQAVQKSNEGHPFKIQKRSDDSEGGENGEWSRCRSFPNHSTGLLAVVMWLMTYVGAVFNGITILILGRPNVPLLASPLNLRVIFDLWGTKLKLVQKQDFKTLIKSCFLKKESSNG
uniref:Reticulon n=1 Tax=Cyprinus carpio TaxID=7962 RepID=A0A8C1WT06_CYPCA